jgi:hypothetical protein
MRVDERTRMGGRCPGNSITFDGVAIKDIGDTLPAICKENEKIHCIANLTEPLNVNTDNFPSEEAHARIAPSS